MIQVAEPLAPIRVDVDRQDEVSILVADGVLDSSTYRNFRDTVIKAALDEPRAVLVDVNALSVPSASAWSVFTSIRWHVNIWPDVPILLVCANTRTRRAITRIGVARYVPVYATRESAQDAVGELSLHVRRRARARLPATTTSARLARAVVHEWLTTWAKSDLIPVASTVATVFVENVLEHTESAPVLIVETYQDTVTVAVEDDSQRPATRHEDASRGGGIVSGLSIVSALSRAWGSTPTPSGKTVWAVVSLEDEL